MHVIDSGGLYGAERVLLELAVHCRGQGHRVIVAPIVAPQDAGDPLGDAARASGLEVMPFLLADGLNVRGFAHVARTARTAGVDVLHSHGYKSNILLAMLGSRQRPPVVATLHGWTAESAFSRKGVYESLERAVLGRLDEVVAVSPTIRRRVPRLYRRSVRVIANGIAPSPPPHAPVDRQVADFVAAKPSILAAGRLSAEKGFDVLLEAMARVARRVPQARLVIAGDGPERARLEALTQQLGLAQRVLLPGYLPGVRSLMRRFDVFVLSSHTEGLPAIVLEAMAEELPVVATRVGFVPEVLAEGECGLLAARGDARALADHVGSLLADARRRRVLADAARRRCLARYTSASMVDAYRRIYARLCGASPETSKETA